MLSSNKSTEQTSALSEQDSNPALTMSPEDEAAAQVIASALSASPDLFNPSDFLTSPVSPWEDDLLTTPAFDADMGMTPDIYNTSPAIMDMGGDFDDLPSLFGTTGYEGYDAKVPAVNSLGPSELPLPPMDEMYQISPGTPSIDIPSLHASPFHANASSLPSRRKNVPTGTRKNVTPESLVPYDAPIQTRKYRTPSSTSRKELPATFARKRARSQAFGEDEEEAVGPTLSEEDAIKAKRLQNTLAARRSRKRKLEYQRELEDAMEAERKEKEMWKARALVLEALLRDKGHEVPRIDDA